MESDDEGLQKPYATTTLQKSFLKKLRFNEGSPHRGDKQQISSKKMKDMRQ